MKRTELSAVGEFGLIDRLTKDIKLRNTSSILGVGDDAATDELDDQRRYAHDNSLLFSMNCLGNCEQWLLCYEQTVLR